MNPALPVPARVDASAKLVLITLIGEAMDAGFTRDWACEVLKLQPRRFLRWRHKISSVGLVDRRPGAVMNAITPELGQRSCPVFLVFSRHIGRVFLPPGRVCHEYETGAVRAGVEEGVVPFNEV